MTGIILLILLLARFVYAFFLHYDRLTLEAAYLLLNYFLITLLIRINKPQLYLLNFDRNSMFFFVLLGITYAVLLYQSVGIFLFLMVVYNRDLLSQNVAFAKTESSLKSILLGVLGVLTLLIYFWAQPDALRFSGNVEIAGAILQANAPVVFFEEFIFRGVLWMALRKINLSERWILMTQAALFGFAHYYFYFDYPVFLFVVIPISGILFGAMVYRTKSIFLSLVCHFLFNIVANLLLF